jgi:hypothetical protein
MDTFKAKMTPLDRVEALSDDAKAALRQVNVTTVEELVGQMEADPQALAELLDVRPSEFERLRRSASEALPPHVREALTAAAPDFTLGALDPTTR